VGGLRPAPRRRVPRHREPPPPALVRRVLPAPFAFVVAFAGGFLESYLLLDRRLLATPVLGVPYLIVLVEVLSLALYAGLRPHLTAAGPRPRAAVAAAPA
jgi:hypothetical protein